jgi:WD40 repeat protein
VNRFLTAAVVAAFLFVAANARADYPNCIDLPHKTLTGHTGSVLSVRFTHDGSTLISGSRDKTVRVWDVASGQLKKTLTNHTGDVYAVVFSHDGKIMATSSVDKTIILWNPQTFEPFRTLLGHTAAIRELACAPADKTLPSVGEDFTFRLWDVATGKLKVTRTEHTKKVKSVAYTPDGAMIATVSHDMTARLWTADGEPKQVLQGHKSGLESCDISPDGKLLMTSSDNGQLIFWELPSGKMLKNYEFVHGWEIDCVGFTPDGRYAVSGSKDRTDKFWDPHTLGLKFTLWGNPGRTESMCFSPDGKTMTTGFGGTDFTIRLYDISALDK